MNNPPPPRPPSRTGAGDDLRRLLRTLSVIVFAITLTAIATTASPTASSVGRLRTTTIGLALSGLLGVLALGTLLSSCRRISRQLDERADLVAETADSEMLYRTTVNSLVDGIIIVDESGAPVSVNESARRLFRSTFNGESPQNLDEIASWLPQMLGEDGQPLDAADRPVVKALAGDGPVVGQVIALRLIDGLRWFRCNATATPGPHGSGQRVVFTCSDITSERRMAADLRAQDRRFRLALEHAPIGMALVSLDGEFLTVNAALCQLTGYNPDQLRRIGAFGLRHPDEPATGRQMLANLAAGPVDVTSIVRRLRAANGSTLHVRLAVSVVRPDDDGDHHTRDGTEHEPYFIVDFLDVSEAVRATELQQAALEKEQHMVRKLLELDHTRSTFVSTVSHELRTPLTSLIGYLEMLEDGDAGALNSTQLTMVDAASRNGDRLRSLIDDLLALTAAERPDAPSRDDHVAVSSLFADLVETMSPLANVGDVSLDVHAVPDGATVVGNRAELERVLINIVGNAIKFTPPGGSVTIDTTCSLISRPEVEITVADTGVGIPDHEHEHLFSRFFRSENAQSNHIQGTGLGLAISAKLVEEHDGRISLTSREGEGTTVTIQLPAAVAEPVGALG